MQSSPQTTTKVWENQHFHSPLFTYGKGAVLYNYGNFIIFHSYWGIYDNKMGL